jgi:hypothetical protein
MRSFLGPQRRAADGYSWICLASECLASECLASECLASECLASECLASECLASECLASSLPFLIAAKPGSGSTPVRSCPVYRPSSVHPPGYAYQRIAQAAKVEESIDSLLDGTDGFGAGGQAPEALAGLEPRAL